MVKEKANRKVKIRHGSEISTVLLNDREYRLFRYMQRQSGTFIPIDVIAMRMLISTNYARVLIHSINTKFNEIVVIKCEKRAGRYNLLVKINYFIV